MVFNFIGVWRCCRVVSKILKRALSHSIHVSSADVLLCGYLAGCAWMSITCGGQCLISLIDNRFYGGDDACWIEAFFHVSGILVQFFSIAIHSCRNKYAVVDRKILSNKIALIIVLGLWIFCPLITFLLAKISGLYLVSNGTYCFYQFGSPAIALCLIPSLVVAIVSMVYSYAKIFAHAKKVANQVREYVSMVNEDAHMIAAKRGIIYVLVILIGWQFAGLASAYELITFEIAPEWQVTAVGVFGTLHSWMAPEAYDYNYKKSQSSRSDASPDRSIDRRSNLPMSERSPRPGRSRVVATPRERRQSLPLSVDEKCIADQTVDDTPTASGRNMFSAKDSPSI